jgi:hypothetical protein
MSTSTRDNASTLPKINGSSSGFIALVVSLSIFVVACCVAIFWLLKYHEPTKQERTRRKAELEAARASNADIRFDPRSLGARIRRALGRPGWVQTYDGEGDDRGNDAQWRGGQELRDRGTVESSASRGVYQQQPSGADPQQDMRNSPRLSHLPSTSTVQLSSPSHYSSSMIASPVYDPYLERTRDVQSPEPSIMTHVSSSFEEHRREHRRQHSMSAEVVGFDYATFEDNRRFSIQSSEADIGSLPMRKWDNGTKFKEDIY